MLLSELKDRMNALGKERTPFLALTDFSGTRCRIWPLAELPDSVHVTFPSYTHNPIKQQVNSEPLSVSSSPRPFEEYQKSFDTVAAHLHRGDTYLVNLTMPTPIQVNRKPEEVYSSLSARYQLFLENEFLFFSPEPFVQIKGNKISSFPMKGTIDASLPDAEKTILSDPKETAEHNTIVDLIRNDLSIAAKCVHVPNFRYIDTVTTHRGELLQVSSQIQGELSENWHFSIGDIITGMLPAGSISGAPKQKTVEIIHESEPDDRGYYTGITLLYDGESVDSCVNIRFIEINGANLIYRSGGGITAQSNVESEYNELLEKIYVPTC